MKKGMTLIELLVASLIMTIGITGLLMSFVTCKKIIDGNTHQLNATILANQLFEGIQRRTTEYTVEEFIADYPTGSGQTPITESNELHRTYFLRWDTLTLLNPSAGSDLTLVSLRISWDMKYTDGDTDNAITMQMITNEPY